MNAADRERREELATLYALGTISSAERIELQHAHRDGGAGVDSEAAADAREVSTLVRDLTRAAVGLAQAAPQVEPPAQLRARVLSSVTGKRFGAAVVPIAAAPAPAPAAPATATAAVRPVRAWPGWLAAAAAFVLAVGVGAYALQLRGRVEQANDQLAAATTRATKAERDLVSIQQALGNAEAQTRTLRLEAAVLIAPDMTRVDLAGQPVAPSAAARAFWSRTQGLVFAANHLPALPANKTYQLWVVAAKQPPISAGLLTPDAQGNITAHIATPHDIPTPVALAVTLEPAGGVPAPTGEKYLVGLTGL